MWTKEIHKDIYRAIYKDKIPNTFPVGFYGTNINHWERDLLIERVSRGNYIIGKRAKLYLENPKEYRKVMKEEREREEQPSTMGKEKTKEAEKIDSPYNTLKTILSSYWSNYQTS